LAHQSVSSWSLVACWLLSANHSSTSPRVIPKIGPSPGTTAPAPGPAWSSLCRTFSTPRRSNSARCSRERGISPPQTRFYNSVAVTLKMESARAARLLFAIGVDPRLDCFSGVRRLDGFALLRSAVSRLREGKPRSIAASDRDLPHCHRSLSVDDSAGNEAVKGERHHAGFGHTGAAQSLAPYTPVRRSP
jgi:hypothetical protein